MLKILIVNLRRNGDIFSSSQLVSSLKKSYPNSEISILIFREFINAARPIKGVSHIFTLDRKEILSLKGNNIFSDGFSLDAFNEQIKKVSSTNWNKVINYSNDEVGTYLTSYLTSKKESQFFGIKYNKNKQVLHSNKWAIAFNEILTSYPFTPINFIDSYHKILDIPQSLEGQLIYTNPKYNEMAFKNLGELRKKNQEEGKSLKIIGIQLRASTESKEIPYQIIVGLIEKLLTNGNHLPILLISPHRNEKEYANKINAEFNNTLISVESDLLAIGSILLNIDLLITPDTSIKHIADCLETPLIEISLGKSPFLKQGTNRPHNFILTNDFSQRRFKDEGEKPNLTAEDIYQTILYYFTKNSEDRPKLSPGVSLFRSEKDSLGTKYTQVAGNFNNLDLISLIISRVYLSKLMGEKIDKNHLKVLSTFPINLIHKWMNVEKNKVNEITKDLLGTLRSLLQMQKNLKVGMEFTKHLDRLLSHCEDGNLCAMPTLMFRAKMESLSGNSLKNNFVEVEELIYDLKGNLQGLLDEINELEKDLFQSHGFQTSNRSRHQDSPRF